MHTLVQCVGFRRKVECYQVVNGKTSILYLLCIIQKTKNNKLFNLRDTLK